MVFIYFYYVFVSLLRLSTLPCYFLGLCYTLNSNSYIAISHLVIFLDYFSFVNTIFHQVVEVVIPIQGGVQTPEGNGKTKSCERIAIHTQLCD